MFFIFNSFLSLISNVYTNGVALGRLNYMISSFGKFEIILTRALADPPCAEIRMFFPSTSCLAIYSCHKGSILLTRSPWFSLEGKSFGSMFAYLLSFEGWFSSFISTGGGDIVKLLLHSATCCYPYFFVIYIFLWPLN